MTSYSEFRLRIDRGPSAGTYRVVATSPSGEAQGRFELPFSDIELENFVLKIGRTRRGERRFESPEMELAKAFGGRLFSSLFDGDVKDLFRSSFADARTGNRGLRIALLLTGAPELRQVPWEFLYDDPSFMSISTRTPIVRYLDLPEARRPLQIALPLRIIGVVSAPSDAEPIDVASEKAKLGQALAPHVQSGAVAINWLETPTLPDLLRQLRQADYHVLHYIGHGAYDHDADDGVVLFGDELGRSRRITGVQLGTILQSETSLRLVVLSAVEGGRSSIEAPFSGVATSLMEREIPAVIGMQFEITDRSAIVFASEFYAALTDGYPVDSAMAEARLAIYADENDVEWATPVLFMSVQDGVLFEVPARASERELKLDPTVAVAAAKAEADAVKAGVDAKTAAAAGAAEAARLETQRADPPLHVDENVQFTVYRPRTLQPGRWSTLLAFAHLSERRLDGDPDEPDPVEEVQRQAAQVLGQDIDSYLDLTQDSSAGVPQEGEITFLPTADGVDFNPPSRTFTWLESVHREEFRLRASSAPAGTSLRGRMSVFLGVRLLAEVSLQFLVSETPAPSKPAPVIEQARPYRRIFASYSHRDVKIAEQFERYAAVFGDRYLRDWIDLRAGEKWSERLEELIRQADVFQLFWSWNSIRSENVRREWEYALGLGRPNFVRPTYWEFPMPNDPAHGLPPSALKALHFHRLAVDPVGPPPAPAAVTAAVTAPAAISVDSLPVTDYAPKSPPPPPPAAAAVSVDLRPEMDYAPMSPPPSPRAGTAARSIVTLIIIVAVTLLAFAAASLFVVGSPRP